jgi:hypothetical protein
MICTASAEGSAVGPKKQGKHYPYDESVAIYDYN